MKTCLACPNPARTPRATYCGNCAVDRKHRASKASKRRNGSATVNFRKHLPEIEAAAKKCDIDFNSFVVEACRTRAEKVNPEWLHKLSSLQSNQ